VCVHTGVAARLIVSLSGLSDDSLDRGGEFVDALDARGVTVSQLYRPGAFGPDVAATPLVRWMRQRRDRGDAIVLHGYDHSTEPLVPGRLARVGRRAEFAALPRHEAGLRLRAARRTLGAVGLRTDLFVPPRWIASAGTVDALREQGFTVLADEHGIRRLDGPGTVRARVLGFRASGERIPVADDAKAAEAWRCRVLVAEVARVARRGGLVRINVRAKDLKRPLRVAAVLTAVDAARRAGAHPTTYRLPSATRAA
jgi:predicted deacetylase